MRPGPEVHDALACLLSYPGGGVGARYAAAARVVGDACPQTAAGLEEFLEQLGALSEGEREELYTRTFDNVAERSLEVGWQLFGENYARGALLVRIRGLLREHGVPEGIELPDHLTHVLPLLGRAPADLAATFAGNQVRQAVEAILEALRTQKSPWTAVLEATQVVLALHEPVGRTRQVTP